MPRQVLPHLHWRLPSDIHWLHQLRNRLHLQQPHLLQGRVRLDPIQDSDFPLSGSHLNWVHLHFWEWLQSHWPLFNQARWYLHLPSLKRLSSIFQKFTINEKMIHHLLLWSSTFNWSFLTHNLPLLIIYLWDMHMHATVVIVNTYFLTSFVI